MSTQIYSRAMPLTGLSWYNPHMEQLIDPTLITITGGALFFIINYLKSKKVNISGNETKIVVGCLSLILAGIYYFWRDTFFWTAFAGILMTSQTLYALLSKQKR